MCDDWSSVRNELGQIGPLDPKAALDSSVLRQWLGALLTTTDLELRRRLESAVMKLPKLPDAVFPLCSLIMVDQNNDIRCYAATILTNDMGRLVETILECQDSAAKLNALMMGLMIGLSSAEMPNNLRRLLLLGMGVFIDRTFPDVWPEAIEELIKPSHSSAYVFEVLGNFAGAMLKSSPSFSVRAPKEAAMWYQFTHKIAPYTHAELESERVTYDMTEKIAFMLSEWCRLTDPTMSLIRPIILAIFRKGCYNFRALSYIIPSFQRLSFEMTQSRAFLCALLHEHVHKVILHALRSFPFAPKAMSYEDRANLIELLHVIFDFYASTLDQIQGAIARDFTDIPVPSQEIHLMLQSDPVCIMFVETAGVFFSRLRQDVEPCYLGTTLSDLVFQRGKDCFEAVLYTTAFETGILPDSEEYENLTNCREAFSDLLPFLYKISPDIVSEFYGLMQPMIQITISRGELSTLLFYFNELEPQCYNLSGEFVSKWPPAHPLVYMGIHNLPQRVDFTRNYFNFLRKVIENSKDLDLSLFSGVMNAMQHVVREPRSTEHCLQLLLSYIKVAPLSTVDCLMIQNMASSFAYNENPEIRNVAIACIANLVACPEKAAQKEALGFLQAQCNKIIDKSTKFEEMNYTDEQITNMISADIEIVGRFCNSMTESSKKNVMEPLRMYLWRLVIELMSTRVPDMCIESLLDSLVSAMNEAMYAELASRIPTLVHTYPHMISRILKDSLKASHNGLPAPRDAHVQRVCPASSTSSPPSAPFRWTSKRRAKATWPPWSCSYVLLNRHHETLNAFIATKSSNDPACTFVNSAAGLALKTIHRSQSEDGIARGLRVLEKLSTSPNPAITNNLREVAPHVINAIFDLVRSFHFNSVQNSTAVILHRLYGFYPEIFTDQLRNHDILKEEGMYVLLVDSKLTRPLILKRLLLCNMKTGKEV
ncbi:hypothetical protein M3Y99_00414000 [Aphelenchoides fujianensis]|nr:hypothetical protein M3Y99_00414000 [Aphelenchoides fujianensis]